MRCQTLSFTALAPVSGQLPRATTGHPTSEMIPAQVIMSPLDRPPVGPIKGHPMAGIKIKLHGSFEPLGPTENWSGATPGVQPSVAYLAGQK